MKDNQTNTTSTNDDDSQPIGTTTGALSGAATGAAMGAAGGPVGAVIGGVAGAVTGGLMGKGVEKAAQVAVDPDAHDTYWQENHSRQPYASQGSYEKYRTAYRTGYEGANTHGMDADYSTVESKLTSDYNTRRDTSSVELEHARPAIRAGFDRAREELRVILHEEKLNVGKREVESGQVHVRKVVHTEQVQVPVELRRENVTIERVSAGEVRDTNMADAFKDQTIEVKLTQEEAVVSKEAHVTGAVRIGKTAETETRTVSDSVRKEDVEVVRDGEETRRTDTTTDRTTKK